jgi:copper homeostasis protein
MQPVFEICTPNLQSVLAARHAGAQRIELCAALGVGGITPSPGLIRQALQVPDVQVYVLIRPREGNFVYSDAELALMLEDIRFCRAAGAAGVVIGALTPAGDLDLPQMRAMLEVAGDLGTTCHRAFDFVRAPFEALEQLIALGIRRVLSSGQAPTAFEGRFRLRELVQQAAGRLSVMPGSGIDADNIREIAETTGAREFHFTGKKKVVQASGDAIPGLENWYWESDAALIKAAIAQV